MCCRCFFFQAEDGIRDLVRSRGLGDVYKRQVLSVDHGDRAVDGLRADVGGHRVPAEVDVDPLLALSLIHI